jgi:hypothetical protein
MDTEKKASVISSEEIIDKIKFNKKRTFQLFEGTNDEEGELGVQKEGVKLKI